MTDLVKFDEVRAEIAFYKSENESLVFDYEDKQGNKEARSHVAKLRKVKTRIIDVHREAKAEALAFGRECDHKKNEYLADVEEMLNVHVVPLDEIKNRKKLADEAIAKKLAEEEAAKETQRQKELEKREAEIARKEAEIQAKETAIKESEEAEQRAAEQAERDKRVAAEAAERAKNEAYMKAEAEKRAILERAAKEKAEIEAKTNAENDARIAKETAAKAEQERLAEIERKRVANESHRQEVEQGIINQINEIIADEPDVDIGQRITDAIVGGGIDNVTINY